MIDTMTILDLSPHIPTPPEHRARVPRHPENTPSDKQAMRPVAIHTAVNVQRIQFISSQPFLYSSSYIDHPHISGRTSRLSKTVAKPPPRIPLQSRKVDKTPEPNRKKRHLTRSLHLYARRYKSSHYHPL